MAVMIFKVFIWRMKEVLEQQGKLDKMFINDISRG